VHNYFIDPNQLIGIGFLIILFTAFLFIFVLFELNAAYLSSAGVLKFLAIILTLFLTLGSVLIYQIFSKESSVKKEFKNIESQHNMVKKILASSQS
jgi:glucan phosphoethanolaminetransferase (alkaline phosphatase superfamily)